MGGGWPVCRLAPALVEGFHLPVIGWRYGVGKFDTAASASMLPPIKINKLRHISSEARILLYICLFLGGCMRKLLCLLLILFSTSTWAGVVYKWETLDANGYTNLDGTPFHLTGMLVIDENAWLRGRASAVGSRRDHWGSTVIDVPPDMFSEVTGFWFGNIFPMPVLGFDVDIRLSLSALATGSIRMHDAFTTLDMASNGSLWTISLFRTDGGEQCGWEPHYNYCIGVTGLWVLDLSTIPTRVPEPATVTLILMGVAFAIIARRYRFNSKNIRSVVGLTR